MNACFNQSTKISDIRTVSTGCQKKVSRFTVTGKKRHTYEIVHKRLPPLNQPKLFGKTTPSAASNSEPLNSARLRKAMANSIRERENRSTISEVKRVTENPSGEEIFLTGTSYLKEIVFFKLLKDATFNLDKLI